MIPGTGSYKEPGSSPLHRRSLCLNLQSLILDLVRKRTGKQHHLRVVKGSVERETAAAYLFGGRSDEVVVPFHPYND